MADKTKTEAAKEPVAEKGIRERLAAANARPAIVTKDIPGFGPVPVRRINALEAAQFETGFDQLAATIVDEAGHLVFSSADQVRAADASATVAMRTAYRRVNVVDVEEAEKN